MAQAPACRRPERCASFRLGLAAILAALMPMPSPAMADITGKPAVIDGNTIEISGRRIRLFGIRAPAPGEICAQGAVSWPCGVNAEFALARKIGSNWVTCLERHGGAGGLVAECHAAGRAGPDIGAWMVAEGWARAGRSAPEAYVRLEARAREARKGIWRGGFEPPENWPPSR